ncbi:MAG: D-tagatose-bisphosphate aldolase, class II, non-catalytic subunit [Spirochaetota bacterium]
MQKEKQTTVEQFQQILADNRTGAKRGIYSICSAHPAVLRASMEQAQADNSILVVESTSNQVDQFGGYTGMTPEHFVAFVHTLAQEVGFPVEKLLLGGDHLGPNAWQTLPAEEAMKHACDLVAAYVKAGYKKIHLDASMFCSDDEGDRTQPLDDSIVAARAAGLCQTAWSTWKSCCPEQAAPLFIIGTEVPIPGGATEEEDTVSPTPAARARQTVNITRAAFYDLGLEAAWERVSALVVQPGVEFGDDQVFHYNRAAAADLSRVVEKHDGLVFEAHSTDYQSEQGLENLVADHFCILKVGPWLTFAYREALFALEHMEQEMLSETQTDCSRLQETLEQVMLDNPKHWQKYYPGSAAQQQFRRKYSFSDRSRYYWTDPRLQRAIEHLMKNLEAHPIPLSLLSQFMPKQFDAVQEGHIQRHPQDLVKFHIREVLRKYSRACAAAKT